jgi:O-antigen/teichoic acid export membrane protein
MIIGFINVRLVLSALGEVDYGIYSLVAGVVGLLAILRVAMSNASMRFMAHSLGTKDDNLIQKTFNTTLFLHLVIGVFMISIIEVGGFFMFEHLLDIPAEKVSDAKIVFHFMAITTFVSIIAVPYDAVINSHENLLILSLVDIFGAVLKLGVAIYLTFSHLNLLVLYGFSMLVIQIIMRIIKQRYSITHYKECKLSLRKHIDKSLAKKILSFSGWNLFGSIAAMSVTQVRSILLNMFFGVSMNTANGIAMQVSSQLSLVSSSMTRALNPQLVKSEGGGDRKQMLRLTELSTKYSIFLFALFAIPVIIEMPYLFRLWLKNVPDFVIIFSRLIIIGLLLDKFTFEITSAIRAVGKIKNFQIVETIIVLFNIPISYLLFKNGFPPYTIYAVAILLIIIVSLGRLYFGKKVTGLLIIHYIKNGVLPLFLPIAMSTFIAAIINTQITESIFRLFLTFFVSMGMLSFGLWKISLKQNEIAKIQEILTSVIEKLTRMKNRNKL